MVKRVVPALLKSKLLMPALAGVVLAAAALWFGLRPGDTGVDTAAAPPISGTVANFTLTSPARPAPIDVFLDAQGHELSLHHFGGKIVLLNLWATWCAPCIKELPSLDRLQAALGGDRFQVVAVSVDRRGAEAVAPYFKKLNISHLSVYVEPTNSLARSLGLQVLPSTIVIGPHGTMLGRLIGAAEWDAPEAQALLRHYIERIEVGPAG